MFNLFGLHVHIYGLLIGIGVWLALEIALMRKKTEAERSLIESVFWWTVLGGIVGARTYHVIDYWNRYYSSNLVKVFYVWEGGLGIWGALLGGSLAVYVYCLYKKIKYSSVLDDLIVGVPVAQAIGRLGNFVNGELYGKNGEPLFAYEAILNLILFGVLWKVSKKKNKDGVLTGVCLIGYGVIRILLEGMRVEDAIWRVSGIPVAVMFGVVAVIIGVVLIFIDSPRGTEDFRRSGRE